MLDATAKFLNNTPRRLRLALVLLGCVLFVGFSAFVSERVRRENGLRALEALDQQRIQLVANAIKSEINRQDHLPVVLALDSDVRGALATPADGARLDLVSHKLERLSTEADTSGLFVVGADGIVLASSDWAAPQGRIGQNVSGQPYFKAAVATGQGRYLGRDPTNGQTRYYIAEAIQGPSLLGVAVVRVEFASLESAWEGAGENIFVTDARGAIVLASDPRYKGFVMAAPRASGPAPLPEGVQPLELTVLERRGESAVVRLAAPEQDTFLYRSVTLPEYGWTVHRLADLSDVAADQTDGAIIGGASAALLISLVLYMIQRHRAYLVERQAGARLRFEVEERTHELRVEIEERKRAEAQLRAAQNELVQAGKLAALGQMSAAIAHEINQPLGAIRTFLASAKKLAQSGDIGRVTHNLTLINDLVERMASITGHLKTFARKSEPNKPELFPVERAVEGALFLIGGQIESAGIRLEKDIQPDVWAAGSAVQLEQVMVNLLSNALDAVSYVPEPLIRIAVRASEGAVEIRVSDNGPGIADDLIERIFDPFMTTKPVGKGLGLGLSISYGIVQEFRGRIVASNRLQGGAELTVELPRLVREAPSLVKAGHA